MTNKKNIYLINQIDSNFYKIGITKKEPLKRLKELQTGNGNQLILCKIFVTEFGNKLERALHLHFKNNIVNSEWFALNENDLLEFEKTCLLYEDSFKVLKDHNNYFFKY